MITKGGGIMKFNTYDRTPSVKAPKWIKMFLISFFVFFTAIMLFVGIIISIDNQSIFPILITVISLSFVAFMASMYIYNAYKAYFEIDATTIKLISYPFFKRRERIFSLSDIKKIKWQYGGRVGISYLIFKNHKNNTLFRTINVPEIKSYFENVGFKIEW